MVQAPDSAASSWQAFQEEVFDLQGSLVRAAMGTGARLASSSLDPTAFLPPDLFKLTASRGRCIPRVDLDFPGICLPREPTEAVGAAQEGQYLNR